MKLLSALFALFLAGPAFGQNQITIYTDRPSQRLQPAIDKLVSQTGANVVLNEGPSERLLNQLQTEGANSPADILILKDLVFVARASAQGLLGKIPNTHLFSEVHPSMVDANQQWLPLSYRARTLIYNHGADPAVIAQLSSYTDLARPEFQGQLCVRTSNHNYNYALGAHLITDLGLSQAIHVVTGWVNNFAANPFTNDRSIIAAVANGQCEFGVVNSYYLGAELANNPRLPVAIKFLTDSTGGVHTNGSAVMLLKHAKNPELAETFIEILFDDSVQLYNSQSHFDYPAKLSIVPNYLPRAWHTPALSNTPWSTIMENLKDVPSLFESADYR